MARPFPVIHAQAAGTDLSDLAVFGERNSGTRLALALLRRNIPAFADAPGDRRGPHPFRYGWQHGFPMMLAAPDHVLCLCVFRHPETWLRAMHAQPRHAAPHLKALPFEAFIRSEWQAIVDDRAFGPADDDPLALQELHWERDPVTGKRFETILALRTAKTAGFLSLPQRFKTCLLLRHEDITRDPEGFVAHIAETCGLSRAPSFQPVSPSPDQSAEDTLSPSDYPPLTPRDRVYVWANLNAAQEQILGFEPLGD